MNPRLRKVLGLLPTYVVIIWAVILTILVGHNYSASNTISKARVAAICAADNETRVLATEIIDTAANGTDAAAVRWKALRASIGNQLAPVDCTTISNVTASVKADNIP